MSYAPIRPFGDGIPATGSFTSDTFEAQPYEEATFSYKVSGSVTSPVWQLDLQGCAEDPAETWYSISGSSQNMTGAAEGAFTYPICVRNLRIVYTYVSGAEGSLSGSLHLRGWE